MERREAYPTDTQHIVNLSGYVWAATQLPALGRLRVLEIACGTGYGSDYLAGVAYSEDERRGVRGIWLMSLAPALAAVLWEWLVAPVRGEGLWAEEVKPSVPARL